MNLDKNYRINFEDANNCILEFFEMRTRTKKDGASEEYEFVDQWFYPSVKFCLIKYLELKQKDSKDIKDCIRITREVEERIKLIK